jgi:hypothetical protein
MTADPWDAFEYEVQMFYETRARLSIAKHDAITRNALVESSLLHRRVLIDALLDRGQKTDDVNLKTLLTGIQKSAKLDASAVALKTEYGKPDVVNSWCWTLNKRLAHLTSVRGDSYDYTELFTALDPLVHAVLDEVALLTRRPKLCTTQAESAQLNMTGMEHSPTSATGTGWEHTPSSARTRHHHTAALETGAHCC